MKILTVYNKILRCHHENKYSLLAEMALHKLVELKDVISMPSKVKSMSKFFRLNVKRCSVLIGSFL